MSAEMSAAVVSGRGRRLACGHLVARERLVYCWPDGPGIENEKCRPCSSRRDQGRTPGCLPNGNAVSLQRMWLGPWRLVDGWWERDHTGPHGGRWVYSVSCRDPWVVAEWPREPRPW